MMEKTASQPDDQRIGKEINLAGVRLSASVDSHPSLIGAGGAAVLGWEALTSRMTIGKMLMTDDSFAQTFRGGSFQDMRDKHLNEFTRYKYRESTVAGMIPDMVKGYKLDWKLGSEVKARGVGMLEAMSKWRAGHWMKVIPAAGATLWSGVALATGNHLQHKEPAADPTQLLDASAVDWRGKAFGAVARMVE